jgi:hypothetical protein
MQRLPQEDLHVALSLLKTDEGIDNQTATRLKKKLAEEFRQQLMFGAPTNELDYIADYEIKDRIEASDIEDDDGA